jgi:hypothetical protein
MMPKFTVPAFLLACFLPSASISAELFSQTSVPQVSGYAATSLSMSDTLATAKELARALQTMAPRDGNSSFVVQSGSYNNAQVSQEGRRNVGFVVQTGLYNTAVVQQIASGHQAAVVQQGIGNLAITTQR